MLIDMHTHIWLGSFEKDKRDLLKASEEYDISELYVSGLGNLVPDEAEVALLNGQVCQFMKENPDMIRGMCYVNPRHANALDMLRRGIEEYGMSGMKLWVSTFCDDPRVFPLVEACIGYKVPVLIHCFHKAVYQLENETVGTHVANLAARYPEATLIMAHLGGNCYNGIKPVQQYPNVYADISGSLFRRDELDYAVEKLGAERILFGSDMPTSFIVCYGQLEEAALTDEQRELIGYKNARRIFARR